MGAEFSRTFGAMKNTIRQVILLFIFVAAAFQGRAQTATTPAADEAEQQLVQQISADMCRRLETENQKQPLDKLSKTEAEQLFARIFLQSASSNDQLAALLVSMGNEGAREKGQQLGRQVGVVLMRECQVGRLLLMRLGSEQLSQQQALRPEETKVLQPIAAAMCRDLQPRVAELNKLPLAQRMPTLTQTFEKVLTPYAKQLNQLYGSDIFLNSAGMEQLGIKISTLMAPQCPEVVLLFADLDKAGK